MRLWKSPQPPHQNCTHVSSLRLLTMISSLSESFFGLNNVPNINSEEKFQAFQSKVASLHPKDIALFRCTKANYLTDPTSRRGLYIQPLAFQVGFYYSIVTLIWSIVLRFRVAPYCLAPNGWRVLVSLPIFNYILGINLGLEELAYLYKLRTDGQSLFIAVCDAVVSL